MNTRKPGGCADTWNWPGCIVLLMLLAALLGINLARLANQEAWQVEQIVDGKVVQTWVTKGAIHNAAFNNLISFTDATTGKRVILSNAQVQLKELR